MQILEVYSPDVAFKVLLLHCLNRGVLLLDRICVFDLSKERRALNVLQLKVETRWVPFFGLTALLSHALRPLLVVK